MLDVASVYESYSSRLRKAEFEETVIDVNESFADLTWVSLNYKTYQPDYKHFDNETAKELIVSALNKIDFLKKHS